MSTTSIELFSCLAPLQQDQERVELLDFSSLDSLVSACYCRCLCLKEQGSLIAMTD